jgi:Fic family protein
MDIKDFKAGSYLKQIQYRSFQPNIINHTFTWSDSKLNVLLEDATLKLGQLNSYAEIVPDIDIFIKMHIFKEATNSSRIEGTKTEIGDAFLSKKDIEPEKQDDWDEVQNYVQAMNFAITELKSLPLSNRLLRHTHRYLLKGVRGESKTPGDFRVSQNWIGGATLNDAVFIPPHWQTVPDLMGDLEKFLHNEEINVPHLIKIAIAHYQFETIHPFQDGNGRLGRLLISLYLVSNQILKKPILYLSDYFEKHKSLYYDNLTVVRSSNNLGQWLKFFLVAVIETCKKALSTLKTVMLLKEECETKRITGLGKRVPSASHLMKILYAQPILKPSDVAITLELTQKSANDLIKDFVRVGILKEITGFKRNKVFVFEEYLSLFRN